MLDIFRVPFTFFKIKYVRTDSIVFRLHHQVTVSILLIFCIIVAFCQLLRAPIMCHSNDIPRDSLNAYCWSHNLYKHTWPLGITITETDNTVIHNHYQWVYVYLLFQAVLFYLPGWFWKNWEGGKVESLTMDLNIGNMHKEYKHERIKLIIQYLMENQNQHTWWTYKYILCELLALINVFGQMLYVNSLLGGAFFKYGSKVMDFQLTDENDRTDPISYVFPRSAKCIFHMHGASGAIQRHDALCFFPFNAFNEDIYIKLWFWFCVLLVITIFWILLEGAIILNSSLRYYVMSMRFMFLGRGVVAAVANGCSPGDWFLLYLVGENVDSSIFQEILKGFTKPDGISDSKLELSEHL